MKKGVTNRQICFIIFLTLTTYTSIALPKIMARSAGRTGWIPIIIVTLIFSCAALIITKLNNMFKGKMLFDYSQDIVGKFFTYIITCYFVLYFLFIGVYLEFKMVGLLTSNFLPLTPQFISLAFGLMLFSFAAYKGITNVARMFEICGVLFLIVTVGICILMLTQGMHYNILPFFNASETKQFFTAAKDLIVPFGGIELLLVIPFTKINKKVPKAAFFTLLFIGVFYILIVESAFMILGVNNTALLNDSFIEAIKVVEMPVIERTDIFYLTFGLTSLFAGMIIIFTAIVELVCKIFAKVKRHLVVIAIGLIFYVLSLLAVNLDMSDLFDSISTYLILTSSILIPTLLFVLAKIKKRVMEKARK